MRRALVVHMSYHTEEHRKTLLHVREVLTRYGFSIVSSHRARLNHSLVKNKDLIVVVGGDGTFLRASQFMKDKIPLLGVNSDPKHKEGFFLRTVRKQFEDRLKLIMSGKAKLTEFTRLTAKLNGRVLPELSLNEFYIGSRRGYRMAEYKIHFKGKSEQQKSSGVIVASGAGTWAWLRSAGGKPSRYNGKLAIFKVREVYAGKLTKKSILTGIIRPGESLTVESLMPDGIVIADSVGKEHHWPAGSKVKVSISKEPLYAYMF